MAASQRAAIPASELPLSSRPLAERFDIYRRAVSDLICSTFCEGGMEDVEILSALDLNAIRLARIARLMADELRA